MNAMTAPRPDALVWFAMRMVAPGKGHRRTAKVGGEIEQYRDRSGRVRKRRRAGTGTRVFVPEMILRDHGFSVFLPVKRVWKRLHGYGPDQELVDYPLLADWMFVGWATDRADERWHELNNLGVVAEVLGIGGRPVVLSSDLIARLIRRWGSGLPPRERRAALSLQRQLKPGADIRVLEGPFAGKWARVLDCDGGGARVALTLFGGDVSVALPADLRVEADCGSQTESVLGQGLPCLRCRAPMGSRWSAEKKHHLACSECGAVGALNSSSKDSALDQYSKFLSRSGVEPNPLTNRLTDRKFGC